MKLTPHGVSDPTQSRAIADKKTNITAKFQREYRGISYQKSARESSGNLVTIFVVAVLFFLSGSSLLYGATKLASVLTVVVEESVAQIGHPQAWRF